ncbi:MAG: Na+:solute symporter [Deltaproteobacteria bacterium]|nr:Na+:solute symporter [Deltaproteobacteria bacterium]
MTLGIWDWIVIAAYGVAALGIGFAFMRRAGRTVEEYFLGGRRLAWYVLGISLVATTFAADTPLAVTEFVRTDGIWGNWFWWIWAVSHALAVFLFSRLWRRAEVMTDAEFIELRYSGRPAVVLRATKAGIMGVFFNLLVLGWVTQAMGTILAETMGVSKGLALVSCGLVAVAYTTGAGFIGVVVSDLLQFVVALAGAIVFAVFAVIHAGGLHAVLQAGADLDKLTMMPTLSLRDRDSIRFVILLAFGWFATHNADAGGYMMQRLSAARNERHAVGASIVFLVGHYVVRVWPWILVALASLVLLPPSQWHDNKAAYPHLIAMVLPAGLRGLMVASLLAAFMSTVDTHLNWGASYLVRDFYQRFFAPNASEKRLVLAARVASVGLASLAVVASVWIDSIKAAWGLLYSMGAGMGPVLILRWFWWRVTAVAELVALGLSIPLGIVLSFADWPYEYRIALVSCISLAATVAVSLWGKSEPLSVLQRFANQVRPGGWWGPVSGRYEDRVLRWGTVVDVLALILVTYGLSLGLGKALFFEYGQAAILFGAAAVGGAILWLRYRGRRSDSSEDQHDPGSGKRQSSVVSSSVSDASSSSASPR